MEKGKNSDSEDQNGPPEGMLEEEKTPLSRYMVPAVVVLLLAIAVLTTNALDTSISGAMLASVSTECDQQISDLEAENTMLKDTLSIEKQALLVEKNDLQLENIKLKNMAEKLDDQVSLYSGIIRNLNAEDKETVTTPYGFKITWSKYLIAKPNEESLWDAEIDNTGPSTRTFTLDLKLESAYQRSFEKEPAVIGSLTLKSYNSGTLNVKLTPDNEGYAIFGVYVNNNYVGDLIVFSL